MPLEETLKGISPPGRALELEVRSALDRLTKPPDSLGRLEETALRIACIQGENPPRLGAKRLFVFAADHSIAEEGVSAYSKKVTAEMTYNFLMGGAAVNVLARHFGVEVAVVDLGVDHDFAPAPGLQSRKIRRGTGNFSRGPAMSRDEAARSIEAGIEMAAAAADEKPFLLGAGEMGIGNTSSAAAIFSVLADVPVREAAGRGTGIDFATWEKKVGLIERGIAINKPNPGDPLDVLSKVGGLEIGAMAGLILGAAARRVPVVMDGYISTASALLAARLSPAVCGYLFPSHLSAEAGHELMLEHIAAAPFLDLGMRLGEGTGACIAMSLIEASVKLLREMATFELAGVSEKIR